MLKSVEKYGDFVMNDFRNFRIGLRNASLILGMTITELREAILSEQSLKGVIPPKPIHNAGVRKQEMMFLAGEVMDCAEAMKSASLE